MPEVEMIPILFLQKIFNSLGYHWGCQNLLKKGNKPKMMLKYCGHNKIWCRLEILHSTC